MPIQPSGESTFFGTDRKFAGYYEVCRIAIPDEKELLL
jgi:hypothetical protein